MPAPTEIPRVGLVTVSLPSERVALCEPFDRRLREALSRSGFEVLGERHAAMSQADVGDAVRRFVEHGASAVAYGIATWVDPPAVVRAVEESGLPALLLANPEPSSFGFTGASLVHGALDRLGLPHRIHLGEPADDMWERDVVAYARAASVAQAFRQMRLGLLGGQAPGQYTGAVDSLDARHVFGLEVEQVDELAVVDRARAVPDDRAREVIADVRAGVGAVRAEEQVLLRSAKLRVALEEFIEERDFAFTSVKCLGETINGYVSFCLAAAQLNAAERTLSCQGDVPATILMEALRRLSGEATFFGDLVTLDPQDGCVRVVNCGAAPLSIAGRRSAVELEPQYDYMGAGGGVTSAFVARPGLVTVAAMGRTARGFRTMIARGTAYDRPREALEEVRGRWPHAFVRLDGDAAAIVTELRSNHVVLAYGDHVDALVALNDLWNVESVVI